MLPSFLPFLPSFPSFLLSSTAQREPVVAPAKTLHRSDSRLSEQSQSEDDSENDSHLELKSVLSDSHSIHSGSDRLSSMGGHKLSPKHQGGRSLTPLGQANNARGTNNKQTAMKTTAAVAPLPAPSQVKTTTTSAAGKKVVTPAVTTTTNTTTKNTASKTTTSNTTTTTAAASAAAIASAATAANDNRAQSAMATQRMKDMLSEVQHSNANNSGKAEKKTGQTGAGTTAAATTNNTTTATTTNAAAKVEVEETKVVPMAPPPTTGPKPFHCLDRAWFPYMTDDGYEYFLTTSKEGVVHSQWEDPRTHGFVEEQEEEDD